MNELENFISYQDSLVKTGRFDAKIIIVYFSQVDDECYVTIGASNFYYSQEIKGFIILKNKMIAFYNPENVCNCGLVDVTKLRRDKKKGFSDENSDSALHTTYEPNGKKYKIHSKYNLELVYSGYL